MADSCKRHEQCRNSKHAVYVVYRYLALFHTTGCVAPKEHNSGPERMLSDFEQVTVLQTLLRRPTSYLYEVQRELFEVTGIWASASNLSQHGCTHKKVELIALQRSEEKRITFMAEISQYRPDMLVWIDETGSDRRKSVRMHGYSLRGIPPRHTQLTIWGVRGCLQYL